MRRIHLICNAHIDPIWQWTWNEGIASLISTFKSAADLADEYDYVFCHGESMLYEALEEYAPELFERIKTLVKVGKWHVSGGWYLQPDCLMPCGETFVRQMAVGKAYFKEKFGVEPNVATNYDSFGHSVGLVQLMVKCGFKGYLICRPSMNRLQYPSRFFKWTAPDGSSVIVSQSPSYYSELGYAADKITSEISENGYGMLGAEQAVKSKTSEDVDYVLWGVGNHGGGPSRKDLGDIGKLQIDGCELIHSSPEDLFGDDVRVGGEIQSSLVTVNPGCYSSMARIKQGYRRVENLFYATEKMLAAAALYGFKFDLTPLKDAEKKLLLSTFHDILPGSCVEDGEREGLSTLYSCEKTLTEYGTRAFLYLSVHGEKAKDGEYPIFVFNCLPYEVTVPIETEFSIADRNFGTSVTIPHVFDESGCELKCQTVKESSTLNLDWRKRIAFEGRLKPLGMTRFSVRTERVQGVQSKVKTQDFCEFEKELKAGGLIGGAITVEKYTDSADSWAMSDAEAVRLGGEGTALELMSPEQAKRFCAVDDALAPCRIIESGDVYTRTECLYGGGSTNVVLQYTAYKNHPYLDVCATVEFADKNTLIRLKIPVPNDYKDGELVGDGPYVWERKPTVGEVSFQKWVGKRRSDGKIFAVINDGVYSGTAKDGYLYLTLLRGAGYCFHPIGDRTLYPQDRYLPRIDCGRYRYNIRLFIGNVSDVSLMAESFNLPPQAVNLFPVGDKTIDGDGIRIDGKIVLGALVPTDGGKTIMRFYNPSEQSEDFTVHVGDRSVAVTACPREVLSVEYFCGKFTVLHDDLPCA